VSVYRAPISQRLNGTIGLAEAAAYITEGGESCHEETDLAQLVVGYTGEESTTASPGTDVR